MKNLANCNPKEFLRQTNRIRKSVANWLSLTNVMEIRKRLPSIADTDSEEAKQEALKKQMKANLSAMLDAALEDHPDETAELLGLCCFIEPEDLENHKMTELLGAISELIDCPEVISFFTSLAKLGQTDIFDT